MRLLIIGGSVFFGRYFVSLALAAGHQVTVLNRGTNDLPEQASVEKLVADREKDLNFLVQRSFDAVIDTCGYRPEIVGRSLQALKGCVGRYVFISTISTYGQFAASGINETGSIMYTVPGEQGNYGTLKADCENVVLELMQDCALIVRPGLIVGPYDPTDRFTYWPARVARGGAILAPGRSDRAIQFIDARDLADWVLKLVEAQACGIYNATGPKDGLTMGEFLSYCQQALGTECKFVRMDDDALMAAGVTPWTELPLWLPDSDTSLAGFMQFDCRKAFAAGLTSRSLAKTIVDTLTWDRTRDPLMPRKAGLLPERERELLSGFSSR